ncbi:MAG TPA: Rpn family recombination-promoting nuclease/putative transposase, partial [Enhygromyxa sp.]|nr:Rpn family recombination-promoting nuclease/putative transposase [Enhygromyxa sp.]
LSRCMAKPAPQNSEQPRTRRPHDALFKAAFEQAEHAAALLRESLTPSVSAAIAWHTIAPLPGTYIDPALADHHSDLLFSVQLDGKEALVYVLLEHQSTKHAYMPLRMLHYSALVSPCNAIVVAGEGLIPGSVFSSLAGAGRRCRRPA